MSVVESCENVQQLKYHPKRLQQTSWVQQSARIVLLGEPVMGRLVDDVMYVGVWVAAVVAGPVQGVQASP